MRNFARHISTALLIALASATAFAAPKGWEPAKGEYAVAKTVVKDSEFEIKATSGMLLVNNSQPVQIKIFTILGRLVNSDTLQPGTSRFILPVHGVYIVKVGDITCKVAV